MAMNTQNVLKIETLWRYKASDKGSGQWEKQYYVLYDSNGKNAARLDWYASEADWKAMTRIRSGIFLEEVERVTRIENTSETRKEYSCSESMIRTLFAIHSNWNPNIIVLRCETESGATDWISALEKLQRVERSKSLEQRSTIMSKTAVGEDPLYDPKLHANPGQIMKNGIATFDVEMEDTAAAVRCELYNNYRLVLTNQHITLVDPVTGNPVLSWLYRYVRRYGVNANSFLLEGGRNAAPGNGLFIFKNCKGHMIREIMESKMKAFSRQEEEDDEKYSYAVFDRSSTGSIGGGANNDASNQRAEGDTKNVAGNSRDGNTKISSDVDVDAQYYNACDEITAKSSPSMMPDICDYPPDESHCVSLPSVHTSKSSGNSGGEKGAKIVKNAPKVMNKEKKPTVSEKPVVKDKSKVAAPVVKDNVKKVSLENNQIRPNAKSAGESDDIDAMPNRPDPAPRMSEVLRQLESQKLNQTTNTAAGEDDVYGYSELDIKQGGRRERSGGQDEGEGHLYGDKLVQQLRKEEECPYEELSLGH